MSTKKLLALWGLKWNPFTPELPPDALWVTPKIESFAWRVEQRVQRDEKLYLEVYQPHRPLAPSKKKARV